MMSISASEARRTLFRLIERVNEAPEAVEIVSRKGNAVLMPADEYAGMAGDRVPVPFAGQRPQAPQCPRTRPSRKDRGPRLRSIR